MSERSDTSSDPVDALVADAQASIARARAGVRPDFAAVLARAQADHGDDEDDDDASTAPTDGLAPVLELSPRPRAGQADDMLTQLTDDARGAVERMVTERRMRPIPPLPRPRPQRSRLGVVLAAGALLAAAVVATVAGVRWMTPAQEHAADDARNQAAQSDRLDRSADEPLVERTPAPPQRPVPAPEPSLETPVAPIEDVVAPIESSAVEPSRRPRVGVDLDALRELSAQARRAWADGDRDLAETKYLQVTALGGRNALAELAWGDLFALARQRGDAGREAKRWRAYLQRFPHGRYADDARGGLCRIAKDPAACWSAYLRDFPRGSYRAEAAKASGSQGGTAP